MSGTICFGVSRNAVFSRRSEFSRPLAGAMEHAEDFDNIIAHAVGDQVGGIGNNQLASALDAPGAAQAGMLSSQFDGPRDLSTTRAAAAGLSRAIKAASASRFARARFSQRISSGLSGMAPSLRARPLIQDAADVFR